MTGSMVHGRHPTSRGRRVDDTRVTRGGMARVEGRVACHACRVGAIQRFLRIFLRLAEDGLDHIEAMVAGNEDESRAMGTMVVQNQGLGGLHKVFRAPAVVIGNGDCSCRAGRLSEQMIAEPVRFRLLWGYMCNYTAKLQLDTSVVFSAMCSAIKALPFVF